jgi:hypothetical protein
VVRAKRGRCIATVRRLLVLVLSAILGAATQLDVVVSAAPASNLFAVVDQGGHLVRGGGVSVVTHIGAGRYEVTFVNDVSRCAYLATTMNANTPDLVVFTASGHLSTNGVYVETKNQGGELTDDPFNLVVVCGAPGTRFAVVGAQKALIVRSTPGATLVNRGGGRYLVSFPKPVSACAFLATVGHQSNGVVRDPGGVYTGSGPDARTVYVETKNLAGGLQDGIPFHLAVLCPEAASIRAAVVDASGSFVRGSAATTSSRSALGNYTVETDGDVSGCAAVATRGSVDTDVPFNPATVEVVPGPTSDAVSFQVREMLFFGGDFTDEAFHAAIVC